MFCQKCHSELNPNDKFCGHCGLPIKLVNKKLITLYFILVLLLFTVGIVFLLNLGNYIIGKWLIVLSLIILIFGKQKYPGRNILSILFWIITVLVSLFILCYILLLVYFWSLFV